MSVERYIAGLARYGIDKGLIEACDRTWAINRIIDALGLPAYEDAEPVELPLEECEGKVAACQLAPYPPGVPVVAPGERISKKELSYFKEIGYNKKIVQIISESV